MMLLLLNQVGKNGLLKMDGGQDQSQELWEDPGSH